MALILVVDDATALAEQYAYDLKRIGGFETLIAASGEQALDILETDAVDCMLLDLEMPGIDGFEVLKRLQGEKDAPPVIVYTGTGNFDRCVQAIRLGARSFIDKAESMAKVVQEIENALDFARLETENRSLRRALAAESELVGSSPAMKTLAEQIQRLAPIPSPVLITGESGTGKELVARELHRHAFEKSGHPFVAINCSALPEQLVESELFGHERGAFTGANRTHKGAFQQASGGTLFLDEIGEMPRPAQAKLLRVLENSSITRVGGEKSINVSTRVICATNRDLDAEAKNDTFRADLFYRLSVHTISVPPLRERKSDISRLARHFVVRTCSRFGIRSRELSSEALEALTNYGWERNNVRELKNVIERMIIATDDLVMGLDAVPVDIRGETSTGSAESDGSFKSLKIEAERRILISALERNSWQISTTAAELGLADHASLLKIMRRLDISRP